MVTGPVLNVFLDSNTLPCFLVQFVSCFDVSPGFTLVAGSHLALQNQTLPADPEAVTSSYSTAVTTQPKPYKRSCTSLAYLKRYNLSSQHLIGLLIGCDKDKRKQKQNWAASLSLSGQKHCRKNRRARQMFTLIAIDHGSFLDNPDAVRKTAGMTTKLRM